MPSSIYTISSGESDDEDNKTSPRQGVNKKTTQLKSLKSRPGTHANRPNPRTDTAPSDEDNIREYDAAGDIDSDNDTTDLSSCEENSGPETEHPSNTAIKRKSADSPKSKGKKKKSLSTASLSPIEKKKLAEEQAEKKIKAELNKMYKSGECMKHMHIEGQASLWARWYMSDVPREAAAAGARVVQAHDLHNPALIMWTRTVPKRLETIGAVALSTMREACERALYVAEAEELCELVASHSLSEHLAQVRALCDCKLTLLVFQLHDYFKKNMTHARSKVRSVHSTPRRRTSNSNRVPMTEIEFELAVTDLLVTADCDTIIANTASEVAAAVIQITKAIAEAPAKRAKRACDEQAAFYMRGDNRKCVVVDKDGVGVGRLWQQMLGVLPQSSLDTARAICARYTTPRALYEALQSPGGIGSLADMSVAHSSRRVGAQFARKLHALFTAHGDHLLD